MSTPYQLNFMQILKLHYSRKFKWFHQEISLSIPNGKNFIPNYIQIDHKMLFNYNV